MQAVKKERDGGGDNGGEGGGEVDEEQGGSKEGGEEGGWRGGCGIVGVCDISGCASRPLQIFGCKICHSG